MNERFRSVLVDSNDGHSVPNRSHSESEYIYFLSLEEKKEISDADLSDAHKKKWSKK